MYQRTDQMRQQSGGPPGPIGDVGPQGIQGPIGNPGSAGTPGTTTYFSNSADPIVTDGINGDTWIRCATGGTTLTVWKKLSGTWTLLISLSGLTVVSGPTSAKQ